jgi:hypothetical protein
LPLPFVSPIYVYNATTEPGLGTVEAPLRSFAEALTAAYDGFTLNLAPGFYAIADKESLLISKTLELVNSNPAKGTVVVGASD